MLSLATCGHHLGFGTSFLIELFTLLRLYREGKTIDSDNFLLLMPLPFLLVGLRLSRLNFLI